jgi:hypothetical protein
MLRGLGGKTAGPPPILHNDSGRRTRQSIGEQGVARPEQLILLSAWRQNIVAVRKMF